MATTWNPADKTAGGTLSNGNLTVTFSGAAGGARSIYSATAGKWYWEIAYTASGTSPSFGVANASAVLSTVSATPTNAAVGYNGSLWVNNASAGVSWGTIAIGNTMAVALDVGAQRLWLRNVAPTSGNWNGNVSNDPATGVGGVNIAVLGNPLFALVAVTSGATWTANFGGSAFAGAVPAGFVAGFGAVAAVAQARALIMA